MLQIGVAVGDIDKVERNAYLQKTGLQVTFVRNYEFLQMNLLSDLKILFLSQFVELL